MQTQPSESAPIVALCERLAAATLARRADWRGDGEGEDRYVWERPEGAVAIASRDRDGEPPYELGVRNAQGELVDQLASDLGENDEPAPWNAALAELYRVARRSAMRADEIIDALVQALPPTGAESLAAVES
jgi:hypothetical protein